MMPLPLAARQRGRPLSACLHALLLSTLVLMPAAGCRAAAPTPIGPEALRPVPAPNLAGLDPEVQAQVQAALDEVVERIGAKPGTGRGTLPATATPDALAAAFGQLGQVLLAYNLDGAEAALANARDLAPGDARWPYYLGRLHQQAGRIEAALADFERADGLNPDDIPTQIRLAQVFLGLGRWDQAEARLDRVIERDPDHALAHALRGELAVSRGDDAAAVEHFSRALALDPSATRLHYMLGMAYRGLGDAEQSREHLARRGDAPVRMADPLGEALDRLKKGSNLLVTQAGIALGEGRVDVAIALYRQALAEDPGNATAHLNLGAALAQKGDLPGAIAEMETAAGLAPDEAKIQQSLGTVLLRAREATKAETALRRSIALDPQNAGARLALADLLRRTGRCAEAVPEYTQGLERDPSQVTARVQQALCHGALGEWARARTLLEANAAAFPNNPDALDALARLLAAAPEDGVRDGRRALGLAERAVARRRSADTVETLAMAQAELGAWAEAVRLQREAIDLAAQGDYPAWLDVMRANLARYEQRQPSRVPWPAFLFEL